MFSIISILCLFASLQCIVGSDDAWAYHEDEFEDKELDRTKRSSSYPYYTKSLYPTEKKCYALSSRASDDWCRENCLQGYCPKGFCVCYDGAYKDNQYQSSYQKKIVYQPIQPVYYPVYKKDFVSTYPSYKKDYVSTYPGYKKEYIPTQGKHHYQRHHQTQTLEVKSVQQPIYQSTYGEVDAQ